MSRRYSPSRLYFYTSCSVLGIATFLFASSNATAREGLSYKLRAQSVYDTNPLGRSDDFSKDTIFGAETTASVIFDQETATQAINTDLSLTRNQFNESDFNSNDASLKVRARKKLKRWLLSFSGNAERGTTRTLATNTLGQSNIIAGRRTSLSASPSVVYNYSPLGTVGVNTTWDQNRYADETGLTDHRTYSLSPFIGRQINPLQSVSLALLYQNYQSISGPDIEVESFGPFVTWQYSFLQNLMVELSLGVLRTEFDGFNTSGGSETNPIYSAKLEHEGKISRTSLSLERAREASTNGSELDVTTVGLTNNFDISSRWDLAFRAEYQNAEQSGFSSSNLDTSYMASLGATYDISRQLKFSTSYRYQKESFDGTNADATRNIIRAGIEYSLY